MQRSNRPLSQSPVRGRLVLMCVAAFLCASHMTFLTTVSQFLHHSCINDSTFKHRFESIERRIEGLAKFQNINSLQEQLSFEERFDSLEHKIDERARANQDIVALQERLASAEKSIRALNETIQALGSNEKDPLTQLLNDAGLSDVDASTLPHWNNIAEMYGSNIVIVGKDTCQRFRDTIPKKNRIIAVAGMFNTGTNLMSQYLKDNCIIPGTKRNAGVTWQVPWGKHMMPEFKWNNTAKAYKRYNKTATLPVVLVRDPYHWMQSMCDHPYAAHWPHSKQRRCPNLIGNKQDKHRHRGKPIPAHIHYSREFLAKFPSLAHIWKEYYSQYNVASYPRLIVRYEDMIFQPQQIMKEVCECAGGKMKGKKFSFRVDNAKTGRGHGKQEKNGLLSAIVKNGDSARRVKGLTSEDLRYADTALGADLMRPFHYERPSIGKIQLETTNTDIGGTREKIRRRRKPKAIKATKEKKTAAV